MWLETPIEQRPQAAHRLSRADRRVHLRTERTRCLEGQELECVGQIQVVVFRQPVRIREDVAPEEVNILRRRVRSAEPRYKVGRRFQILPFGAPLLI